MKEKDHIEAYFKKHLDYYEESPDEDFWARVSPAIEVPTQKNNHKILWLLLLLMSLLLSGFLLGSITWDRSLDIEKEEKPIPIAMDDVLIDNPLDASNQSTIEEKRLIQEVERAVEQTKKTQFIEEEQSSLVAEKKGIDAPPQITEFEDHEIVGVFTKTIGGVPKIQPPELKLLTDKIAELNYVASELPESRRPLRIQPYVSLHSYQLQSTIYEGIRRAGNTERETFRPHSNIFNIGLDVGVTLNEQFYIQMGFNQNYSRFIYQEIISRSISEQEIAILFDGLPINFDFTMDAYFDEIEGKLKLTPKTSEIEAGDKFFSIEAQRKVQTTRWTLATAYKVDVSNIVRLTPKIGISKVNTKYQSYERISGKEILSDAGGKEIDNQLNTGLSISSTGEEIELKNTEWLLGFQAEIPIDKQGKWLIVPTGELWFDAKPILERPDVKVQRSVLTLGAGLRYLIH